MHASQIEFLRHILDECNYLKKESEENTFEEFKHNERLLRAVCRSLEIIGEASQKIGPDIKAAYPYVQWREMSDLRNRIIHHYFGIDYDIVWDIVQHDIPLLRKYIHQMIQENEL
jgi:uncharacterized protein with HEPN domain